MKMVSIGSLRFWYDLGPCRLLACLSTLEIILTIGSLTFQRFSNYFPAIPQDCSRYPPTPTLKTGIGTRKHTEGSGGALYNPAGPKAARTPTPTQRPIDAGFIHTVGNGLVRKATAPRKQDTTLGLVRLPV